MKITLPFSLYLILLCILLSTMTTYKVSCFAIPPRPHLPTSDYIQKSCETTLYPHLCNKTLAKYAMEIQTSPKRLAVTALLVTFNTTQSTSNLFRNLTKNQALKPGEIGALIECVEVVSDSVYELQKSLKQLNESREGPEFIFQMDDVQTWVSAALTDDNTCLDDFTTNGKMKTMVRNLVRRIARLTSIALAFINNYAAT